MGATRTIRTRVRRPLVRLSAEERRCAWLSLFAVLGSRVLIWAASLIASDVFGSVAAPSAYVPSLEQVGTGLGGLVQFPIIRWDGAWYLTIAEHGYALATSVYPPIRVNFFPLYPLLIAALHGLGIPFVLGAFLISMVCFGLAVYGIARLVTLEIGPGHPWASGETRTLTVLAVVLAPVSFYFSAAYTESLCLACSVGVFLGARHGRWGWAGLCAGLASATRGPGLLLVLPLAWIYLYGPRQDRPPDRVSGWRPRYRLRADVLWLALAPAGLLIYMVFLTLSGAGALAFVATQRDDWGHVLTLPWTTVWHGLHAVIVEIRRIGEGREPLSLFGVYPGASLDNGWEDILPFAALLVAVPALVGVWRRLPVAYGLYVTAAILLVLASPVIHQPLQSLPRYLVILFPLLMSFGGWLARHRWWRIPALAASTGALVLLSAEFATWHFVG